MDLPKSVQIMNKPEMNQRNRSVWNREEIKGLLDITNKVVEEAAERDTKEFYK